MSVQYTDPLSYPETLIQPITVQRTMTSSLTTTTESVHPPGVTAGGGGQFMKLLKIKENDLYGMVVGHCAECCAWS